MKRLALAAALASAALPVLAQENGSFLFSVNVPTLDEVGLAGMIVLVAAVGGWFARRRK